MAEPRPHIVIDALDPESMALWRVVAKIAALLGEDGEWCLVGGLLVALHAIEAGQRQRATKDIDILADARSRPSGTEWATTALTDEGAVVRAGEMGREFGFRFDLDGQIVDVLAPDGLGAAGAKTMGNLKALQIPGGTQALARTEVVDLSIGGETVALRRPTLAGALLLKARALPVSSHPEDQRYDIITLLSLLTDPRTVRSALTANELKWLRRIDERLALDETALSETFDEDRLRVARAAYRILVG